MGINSNISVSGFNPNQNEILNKRLSENKQYIKLKDELEGFKDCSTTDFNYKAIQEKIIELEAKIKAIEVDISNQVKDECRNAKNKNQAVNLVA